MGDPSCLTHALVLQQPPFLVTPACSDNWASLRLPKPSPQQLPPSVSWLKNPSLQQEPLIVAWLGVRGWVPAPKLQQVTPTINLLATLPQLDAYSAGVPHLAALQLTLRASKVET